MNGSMADEHKLVWISKLMRIDPCLHSCKDVYYGNEEQQYNFQMEKPRDKKCITLVLLVAVLCYGILVFYQQHQSPTKG